MPLIKKAVYFSLKKFDSQKFQKNILPFYEIVDFDIPFSDLKKGFFSNAFSHLLIYQASIQVIAN